MRRQLVSTAVLLSVFGLLLPRGAAAEDNITFATDFGYMGRHAYYFLALERGYYKEAALNVSIVRGQGSGDTIKQVAAGTAQIGFADATTVILNRANDGAPVKLVAMVYSRPPQAIFALESSAIKVPKDLEGKSIADTASSSLKILFPAYAKAAGIDSSAVRWVLITPDARAGTLALGHADAVPDYLMGEALFQKTVGSKKLVRFTFAEAGMDFYSNGIISNDRFIKSNPDVIRRFVAATFRGLKDAIADPHAAAKILHKYQRNIEVDVGASEMKAVGTLVQTPSEPSGVIDPARLQKTIDLVASAFDLKAPVSVEDVYAPSFAGK